MDQAYSSCFVHSHLMGWNNNGDDGGSWLMKLTLASLFPLSQIPLMPIRRSLKCSAISCKGKTLASGGLFSINDLPS
jgi:hypothetical protein